MLATAHTRAAAGHESEVYRDKCRRALEDGGLAAGSAWHLASWNLRDSHMFDTLESPLGCYRPESRGIVWAQAASVRFVALRLSGVARLVLRVGVCLDRMPRAL